MGWNLFGGLMSPTANHTEEKERRHSGDSGTEEEFEILEREEIKEAAVLEIQVMRVKKSMKL